MTSRGDILGLMLLITGCDLESIVARIDQIIDQTLKIPRDQFASTLNFRSKYANVIASFQNMRESYFVAIQRCLERQGLV